MNSAFSTLQVLLSDKQYGFCFCKLTVNVLLIFTERDCQALYKNVEVQAISLDILKVFDILVFTN